MRKGAVFPHLDPAAAPRACRGLWAHPTAAITYDGYDGPPEYWITESPQPPRTMTDVLGLVYLHVRERTWRAWYALWFHCRTGGVQISTPIPFGTVDDAAGWIAVSLTNRVDHAAIGQPSTALARRHAPITITSGNSYTEEPEFEDICELCGYFWPCPPVWLGQLPDPIPCPPTGTTRPGPFDEEPPF